MSDIEVKELAAMVKAPVDVLMRQLKRAGIHVSSPADKISDAQKLMLLEHMNDGVESSGNKPANKKITLKKRSDVGGARKGGVEVRRKKTLSLRNSDHRQPMKRDLEAEKRAEELAQKIESERLMRESLIQKAERERREIEAMRLRGEPVKAVAPSKDVEVPEQDAELVATTAVASDSIHVPEVESVESVQPAAVVSEPEIMPETEVNEVNAVVSEAEVVVPSASAVSGELSVAPNADENENSATAQAQDAAVEENQRKVEVETSPKAASAESVAKSDAAPVTQSRNNKPVEQSSADISAKIAEAEKPVVKEMSALEKRQAVADAARREAAAALKRRPSRAKAKPSLAPKNTIDNNGAGAKPTATEKAAEPAEKVLNNKKQDKKRAKTRGRENERGNVKQSGRRKGNKRQQEPVIDREVKHGFEKPTAPVIREIEVPSTIVVSDLAQKLAIRATDIIKSMMKMGMMVTINQSIDQETALLVVEELGHVARPMQEVDDESILAEVLGDSKNFEKQVRPPVITIMGHVDHGKTSLLDYIRETRVASGEAGGITQHIGAYHVKADQGSVTFLDTPGHAAFTKMRARGAQVTDIVILIVAADDGVKPQTKEAIQHAKAAEVPMVVAINKMDKPEADPDRVLNELSQNDVLTEEWGGEVPVVRLSAKTGQGIDELLETLLLVAEVQELTAAPDAPATGTVIEASIERGRGVVATVLVREGTLAKGDLLLCGKEYGRIRAMFDERGRSVKSAGPSIPVSVLGLSGVPEAGDEAFVVSDERKAREIAQMRQEKQRDTRLAEQQSSKLDNLFNQMQSAEKAQLNVLIKADVQGSLEAIRSELIALSTDEIEVRIISSGIGGLNEGDIDLATASNATVIAFNVRADATARRLAQEGEIEIRYYSIIYDVINDIKDAMSGMLSPETKEVFLGLAEVKDVFRASGFGQVAGCLVVEGSVRRGNPIRVLRDNVVIFEGELESLRRHRDDVKEVNMGTECGIAVKNYNDVRAGDQIEVFEKIEVARKI